jgi:hypothetical protein
MLTAIALSPALSLSQAERVALERSEVRAILFALNTGRPWTETSYGVAVVERCALHALLVSGVDPARTSYRRFLDAWDDLRALVGWREVSSETAAALGHELRKVGRGRRRGRHVVVDLEQRVRLQRMHEAAVEVWGSPVAVEPVESFPVERQPSRSTVAVRCPFHADERPSMVLWRGRSSDDLGGAARCLSCGARASWRDDGAGPRVRAAANPADRRPWTDRKTDQRGRGGATARRSRAVPLVEVQSTVRPSTTTTLRARPGRGGWSVGAVERPTAARSLGSLLRWHARRWSGPAGLSAAWEGARLAHRFGPVVADDALAACPDRLFSMDVRWADEVERRDVGGREVPVGWRRWRSLRTRLRLVDLDGLSPAALDAFEARGESAVEQVARAAAVEGFGVAAIVRTSDEGIQVVLCDDRFRDVSAAFEERERSRWAAAAEEVRRAVGAGGKVDAGAFRPGATGRLPGWRVKHGVPTLARLLWAI